MVTLLNVHFHQISPPVPEKNGGFIQIILTG